MNTGDRVCGNIYVTYDYSKFKRLKGNRDVDHERAIYDSIKKVGYVRDPILVNEKFEVIDGQNRLMALEKAGLPVEYTVQEGIGLKECQSLNIGQKNWTTNQWIASYAEQGIEPYIALNNAMKAHPAIGHILLIIISYKVINESTIKALIISGELNYHEPTYSEERVIEFLEEVSPYVIRSGFASDKTLRTLARLADRKLIDNDRMLKQFKEYANAERFKALSFRYVLEDLQDLYNYNRRKIVFFADRYREISNNSSSFLKNKQS